MISFKRPLNLFTLASFPVDNEDVIAPYWTDIDITDTGNVFFREAIEDEILDKITNEIRTANSKLANYKAHWAFIVTWDHVVQNRNFNDNKKVHILIQIIINVVCTYKGRNLHFHDKYIASYVLACRLHMSYFLK